MIHKEEVRSGKTFLVPFPDGYGMVETVVDEVFGDVSQGGILKVRHHSSRAGLGATPTLERFCEIARNVEDGR